LFEGFLDYLIINGFEIGVDRHLRLRSLLNQIDPDLSRKELKLILAPIFADSEERQDAFYGLYDRYFGREEVEKEGEKEKEDEEGQEGKKEEKGDIIIPEKPKKRRYVLIGLGILAALALVIYLITLLNPESETPDKS
jgi:uncharacterized protein with von Willebrand factor type A (vWA) domain